MDSESHCLGFSSETRRGYILCVFRFYQTLYYGSLGILLPNFDILSDFVLRFFWYFISKFLYFIRLCITVHLVFYYQILIFYYQI